MYATIMVGDEIKVRVFMMTPTKHPKLFKLDDALKERRFEYVFRFRVVF